MAFPFDPVRFIRSETELSNRISESDVQLESTERPALPLSGEDAHSFYVSLVSTNDELKSPSQTSSAETSTSEKRIRIQRKSIKVVQKRFPVESVRNRFLKTASSGDLTEVQKILADFPSVLNLVDEFGWSALMCSAYEGHTIIVDFLLRHGADTSIRNRQNRTAMNLARRRGHREIVELLEAAENGELSRAATFDPPATEMGEPQQEFYCDVCSATFQDPNHETSTIHQLRLVGESSGPDKPSYLLPHSNRGFQLMLKDGWDTKQGLGRHGQGRWYPVKTILKRDRRGLGAANAPKPRVTHFGPNDSRAIEKYGESSRVKLKSEENMTKKQRMRKEAKEKEWVRRFRREFY